MTAHTTPFAPAAMSTSEESHRRLVTLAAVIILAATVALALYGHSYYRLSQADRAFSPQHHLLKPSGIIGISSAFVGMLMLCGILLYPLRKRWAWLQRQGDSKHWLDHHVVFGIAAPLCIAFHSSFKFHGLAGIAFWTMMAVSVSGLVGRYLYAQVLREEAAAKTSLLGLRARLERQRIIPQADLRLFFQLPEPNRASHWPVFTALGYSVLSDLTLPVRVARLRKKCLGVATYIRSVGGLLSTENAEVEELINLACRQARLTRRIMLLSQARQVFKLWHVVHKPFSYAFAVLALLHIGVAMLFGFV